MSVQLGMFEVGNYDKSRTGPCTHCGGEKQTTTNDPWGVDPCLGHEYLADVAHSCCGHGVESRAYVVISRGCTPCQSCEELPDRITLEGREALDYLGSCGVGPDV
jgi:hypothetical protein